MYGVYIVDSSFQHTHIYIYIIYTPILASSASVLGCERKSTRESTESLSELPTIIAQSYVLYVSVKIADLNSIVF